MYRAAKFRAVGMLGRCISADTAASAAKFVFLRELLDGLHIATVLDVGANEGQFATALRYLGYRGHIHSFEPLPDVFERLTQTMAKDRAWTGSNVALGEAESVAEINIMALSAYSSFNRPIDDQEGANRVVATCPVKVCRLDRLLAGRGLSRTLLKVDTQGCEIPVLGGLGDRLPEVAAVMCEVSVNPIYDKAPDINEVVAFLTARGFKAAFFAPVGRMADMSAREFDFVCVHAPHG